MPLESVASLISSALQREYAVGYFESWNLESLAGVIDAAEQTRSPIVVGFNGEFLSRPQRHAVERLKWYAQLGRAAAESASVPCGLIFNECPIDDWVMQAAAAGFNLVMLADPTAPYDDYLRRVRRVVEHAHGLGVAVEAELGQLPCGSSGSMTHRGTVTDPQQAASFVEKTGVDLLAVSVGNVHVMVQGQQGLDLSQLERIHKVVPVPLVLHGGTGIPSEVLGQALAMGVVKVNYGTYLKQSYLAAVRRALDNDLTDPHLLLGRGGSEDVMVAGRRAVRDAVLERIGWLGCCQRA